MTFINIMFFVLIGTNFLVLLNIQTLHLRVKHLEQPSIDATDAARVIGEYLVFESPEGKPGVSVGFNIINALAQKGFKVVRR